MAAGPNYVLDKGFIVDATTELPINQYEAVRLKATPTTGTTITQIGLAADWPSAGSAGDTTVAIGVAQYDVGYGLNRAVDLSQIANGKVMMQVRLMGITRMVASAAIGIGAMVGVTAYNAIASTGTAASHGGRAVAVNRTATSATPVHVIGRALQSAANAGDWIDVLLTPGALY